MDKSAVDSPFKGNSKKSENFCSKFDDLRLRESYNCSKNEGSFVNVGTGDPLRVFHQNLGGLKGKVNELINSVIPELPHMLCITEHHLKDSEVDLLPITHYKLGAKYCRQILKNGGVSIYVHTSVQFTNISLQDQDIETCAVKLNIKDSIIIVLGIYRSLSGHFDYFLHKLENIMNVFYNNKTKLIMCGDVNINYPENCSKTQWLDTLTSYFQFIGCCKFSYKNSQ
jgi:exonuclease III